MWWQESWWSLLWWTLSFCRWKPGTPDHNWYVSAHSKLCCVDWPSCGLCRECWAMSMHQCSCAFTVLDMHRKSQKVSKNECSVSHTNNSEHVPGDCISWSIARSTVLNVRITALFVFSLLVWDKRGLAVCFQPSNDHPSFHSPTNHRLFGFHEIFRPDRKCVEQGSVRTGVIYVSELLSSASKGR